MPNETQAVGGYGGKVYVGEASSPLNEVADVGEWSGDLARDAIEVPKFQVDRARIPGKRDFSGSFSGNWYMKDTTGQKVLQDALLGGTVVYLKLQETNGAYYCCYALITGIPIGHPHDGAVSVSFTFVSTGKIQVLFTSAS